MSALHVRRRRKLGYISYASRLLIATIFLVLPIGALSGFRVLGLTIVTPAEGILYFLANPGSVALLVLLYTIPWVVLTAFLGRAFCSYVCPAGLLIDIGISIRRRLARRRGNRGYYHSQIWKITGNYVLFSGGVLFVAAALISHVLGSQLMNIVVSPFSDFFKAVRTFPYVSVELVFLLVIVLVSIPYPRVWCRLLCPSGFIFTIFAKFFSRTRMLALETVGECKKCDVCRIICPLGVSPLENSPACTLCLECYDRCPWGALRIRFKPHLRQKPQH